VITFHVKSFIEGIKGQSVHSTTDPMKNLCAMCRGMYRIEEIVFEQRLIADEDFCPRCWNNIMTATYDNDLDNDFSRITLPG
jgi:hypothetical protein